MSAPRRSDPVESFGELLADYCLELKPRDELLIVGGLQGLEGIKSLYMRAVVRGAYPRIELVDDELLEFFYRRAPRELLEFLSPIDEFVYSKVSALAKIGAPSHTKPLLTVDPERISARARATRRLKEIFLERDARRELRWVTTHFPTPASAQEAGFAPLEWREFVFRSMKLHEPDPVAAWREQASAQERIARALSKIDELRILSEDSDLLLKVGGRTWLSDDGKNNMPGGEVFTAPLEDTAEGAVSFTYPALWGGAEIEGVRLVFRRGVVVEARALRGDEFLRKMLSTDEGASRLGEVAFGLNYDIDRFTKHVLFDEKIGGTIHLALGAAYPATGGRNASSIHWDMVKDMRRGKVLGDGDVIYENGRFLWDLI
ncbi:MAG: aminopeptidase [Fervidicoccaceae archaeon]